MCSARLRSFWILCYFLELMAITGLMSGRACGQTASTGALDGTALDPTGAALPDVTILLANQETSEEQSTASDEQGRFGFQFLPSCRYQLRASKASFEPLPSVVVNIRVTETLRIELRLRLATTPQSIQVSSDVLMIQTDNSALGRAVSGETVTSLPLVTPKGGSLLQTIFVWSIRSGDQAVSAL